MRYKIIRETGTDPVTASIAVTHLKIDPEQISLQEYSMLENFVLAARKHIEDTYGHAIVTKTVKAVCDEWPDREMDLPISPLRSVTSVKYFDEDETEYTLSSSSYQVDTFSEPGKVVLKRSSSWPSTTLRIKNGILIDYVVGLSEVDENIIKAIYVIVDHLWQLRERNNNPAGNGQIGISDMLTRVNDWELELLLPPGWKVSS